MLRNPRLALLAHALARPLALERFPALEAGPDLFRLHSPRHGLSHIGHVGHPAPSRHGSGIGRRRPGPPAMRPPWRRGEAGRKRRQKGAQGGTGLRFIGYGRGCVPGGGQGPRVGRGAPGFRRRLVLVSRIPRETEPNVGNANSTRRQMWCRRNQLKLNPYYVEKKADQLIPVRRSGGQTMSTERVP